MSHALKRLHLGKDRPANEPETELRRKACVKRATRCRTSKAIKRGGAHRGKETFQLENGLQYAGDIFSWAGAVN